MLTKTSPKLAGLPRTRPDIPASPTVLRLGLPFEKPNYPARRSRIPSIRERQLLKRPLIGEK